MLIFACFNEAISILTVCSFHATYAFQSESTHYSCLNVKELLARSRREIWSLSDCNFPHQEIWWSYCILHSALPAWPNLCNPCFRQFSYICIYWNTVLLMIMSQNWGYESRFDVIISSQPYWNYHGFLSPLGDWCLREQKKLLDCHLLGGISTLADTMMRLCLLTVNETYQIKTREKFSGKVVLFI